MPVENLVCRIIEVFFLVSALMAILKGTEIKKKKIGVLREARTNSDATVV